MDFEIQFNDLTLLNANGNYNDVCEIMKKPTTNGVVDDIMVEKWMIESIVTIQSQYGFSSFSCHFYWDGKIMIADYSPTIKDVHNPDIRCLTFWAQQYGWKRPEPLPSVIDSWNDFWHIQWETFIIDSDYFDKHFGKRKERLFSDENDENLSDNNEEGFE